VKQTKMRHISLARCVGVHDRAVMDAAETPPPPGSPDLAANLNASSGDVVAGLRFDHNGSCG